MNARDIEMELVMNISLKFTVAQMVTITLIDNGNS